jgi:hypothetical protein
MKNLIIALIAIFAIGTAFAENTTAIGENGFVNATIITPLSIVKSLGEVNDFGKIIQGQAMTYTSPKTIALFTMTRELNEHVVFTVQGPTPATGETGVTLNSLNYFYTGNWGPETFTFPANTELQWLDAPGSGSQEGGTIAYMAIQVTKATATADAALGVHTFNVHVIGSYQDL